MAATATMALSSAPTQAQKQLSSFAALSAPGSALRSQSQPARSRTPKLTCRALQSKGSSSSEAEPTTRRAVLNATSAALAALLLPVGAGNEALAISASRRAMREEQVKEEDFTTLDNGLKVYDVKVGGGRMAELGDRVTVHYVVKWKGVTFMTSRQGAGVTGGTPYGFDVGASDRGYVLKGLDLGVQGMRVGGQRELVVPPELAYGKKGIQEIPPGATLEMNIELLSIKESPLGYQVKLVEG